MVARIILAGLAMLALGACSNSQELPYVTREEMYLYCQGRGPFVGSVQNYRGNTVTPLAGAEDKAARQGNAFRPRKRNYGEAAHFAVVEAPTCDWDAIRARRARAVRPFPDVRARDMPMPPEHLVRQGQ